ncbi:MAG: sortase [Actinomycetota bacterium]
MNLKRSTLIASGVAVLVLAGIAYTYVGPSPADDGALSPSGEAASEESSPPRVLRVLDELRNGEGDDAPVRRSDVKGKSMPFAVRGQSRAVLGTMEIPAVDVKTRFYSGVVDEVVEGGPGLWPGTAVPGNPGNAVFAGHRTTFTAPFADLDLLNEGDAVGTTVGRTKPVTYRVYKTTIVPEAEYVDFVLQQPSNKRARTITLLACEPKGQRTHRIVVQARAARDR